MLLRPPSLVIKAAAVFECLLSQPPLFAILVLVMVIVCAVSFCSDLLAVFCQCT